jgi:hypothetical protein
VRDAHDNFAPLRSERFGVTTSSSPLRLQSAVRWSTETLLTPPPAKSRLKRESGCVARATIVTVPSIACDGALVAY